MHHLHCDVFPAKLQQQGGLQQQPHVRTCPRGVRNGSVTDSLAQPQHLAHRTTSASVSSSHRQVGLSAKPLKGGIIRKEIYPADDAMVEVTVKTHNARNMGRKSSVNCDLPVKDTWGKLLQTQTNSVEQIATSSFKNFDPLRTLHFLTKELQSQIQTSNSKYTTAS